jgi:hypothetical protein
MLDLLAILLSFAAFPACLLLARSLNRFLPAEQEWSVPIDTGSLEPCWTEEIISDGRFHYARSQCVNDLLMEFDERARRANYPFNPGGA